MKYLYVVIGCFMSLYVFAMFIAPFSFLYARHETDIYSHRILNEFVTSWNEEDNPMGKIQKATISQKHSWINISSVGALLRADMVLDHWQGFLEIFMSKHGETWKIDNVIKGD